MKTHTPNLVLALLCLLMACSDSEEPARIQDADLVTVTGEVTEIDDQVPVDGGVRMTLELDEGGVEVLWFGSLFTDPPPSPEQQALYQKILQVNVNDRIQAQGRRIDNGLLLQDLTLLNSR